MQAALRLQRILAREPAHAAALAGMSLVALASRQTDAAIATATAATAAAPTKAEVWIALGQCLTAASRFDEAGQAYCTALGLGGMHPLIRLGLGELRLTMGRPAQAVTEFELALRCRPAFAAAELGLGNALARLNRNEEALRHYRQALALAPRSSEAHFAAGFALARLHRPTEAEARYRRALALRPDFAAAWLNLGALLREQGRDVAAEAALRRAAMLRPEMVTPWLNLALIARSHSRPDQAETSLRRALEIDPKRIETLLGWCYFRQGEADLAGARKWLEEAQALAPEDPEVLNTEGILLHCEGCFAQAIGAFERAEVLGHRTAASNRGNALIELGSIAEALDAHQKAVALDPHSAGAQYNLALTQLRAGDWLHGWRGYEARWRFSEVKPFPLRFRQPRWHGEPLRGKRILLHAEQGLGDTIQFCRYAALVAARGGVPVLAVQPPVERLMYSLAVVRAGNAEVMALATDAGHPSAGFDVECPLMSLPAVFATTQDSVPCPDAYLSAPSDAVAEKRAAFPGRTSGPRIGIAWAGNPRYKTDAARSTRLATFLPLLEDVEANWFSLQKGEAAEQMAGIPGKIPLRDGSSGDRDLAETAALIATLDLVITTDTSIAHLAGAIGKPVWILLPFIADWRWMQETETTPWYPTARLFRQPARGDWDSVMRRVWAELRTGAKPST